MDLSFVELEIRKAPILTLHDLGETPRMSSCAGTRYNIKTTGIGGGWKLYGFWVLNKVLVRYCLSLLLVIPAGFRHLKLGN